MFNPKNNPQKFENKVWLSSPTMHGEELEYIKSAYEANRGMKDNRDNR